LTLNSTPEDTEMSKTTAERLADKVSNHRSEVAYGADCEKGQKRRARRNFSRADRRASRAACEEARREH
jgi:hypothetical protein